jgi:thymidine phosphorylase
MSDPEQAKNLATIMVELGKRAGVKTRALVTAMDIPLGLTVGNALEVRETLEVLAGGGPKDVVELTLTLAREMLSMAGVDSDPEVALKNGLAMDRWRKMITMQGGDPDAPLPTARERHVVNAETSGTVTEMDALKVGVAAWRLGAGRSKQGEKVQAGAGIEIHAKPGEKVNAGSPLFTLHTDEPARVELAVDALVGATKISASEEVVKRLPLIVARVN